jgi:hypothetical protein
LLGPDAKISDSRIQMASKRKGKPLLVATIGLATISFAACKDPPKDDTNALGSHENTTASAVVPGASAVPAAPSQSAAPAASVNVAEPDAGSDAGDAGDAGDAATPPTPIPSATPVPPKPPRPPVGNLRPPPRPPVGNLRAPIDNE